MSDRYDPYKLDSLLEQLNKPPVTTDLMPSREGIGEGIHEFLGQALWGGISTFTMGTPEYADMIEEAATEGATTDRLEKIVTSLPKELFTLGKTEDNYAGDFSASATTRELGLAGKMGYTAGSILGMVNIFGALKKGLDLGIRGVARGVTKAGIGKATKTKAIQIAQDDILESFGQVVYKAGQKEGAQAFTEKEAAKIAKDSFEIISKSGARSQGARQWGDAAFQAVSRTGIKEEVLRPIIGEVDEALLDDFAKEALEVVMRRTPDEARNIIDNAILDITRRGKPIQELSRKTRIGSSLASAMIYESMLGGIVGAVRGLGQYKAHEKYKYEVPEDMLGYMTDMAKHEGFIFSFFGPLKFIKGGSSTSAWKKTKDMVRGVTNQLKPIGRMTTKEMSANVELLHSISGDGILGHKAMQAKWSGRGWGWWRDVSEITSKSAKKKKIERMKEFLKDARGAFVKDAPGLFMRELGADMFQSLPRMMTGAVVMNLTSLHDAIKYHGIDGIMEGFGATDYEKVSNILTAAYFTRQPHSFNLPGTPYRGPFESGAVKKFATKKAADYTTAVTGLNLLGAKNFKTAVQIANQYGGFSDTNPKNMNDKLFNKSFEGSQEVQEIKEIIDPHSVDTYKPPVGEKPAGDLFNAGSKFILEDVSDPAMKAEWRDKLSIANNIVKWHNENSRRSKPISPMLTKKAASELIDRLSSIKFDGKTLSSKGVPDQLTDWYAARVEREGNVAIGLIKEHVIDSYNALGVPVKEVDGKINVPKIDPNLHGEFLNSMNAEDGSRHSAAEVFTSLHTAIENLEKIGIVRLSNEIHETSSAKQIKQVVDVKAATVDKMMHYVHGPAKDTKITDEAIIRNPVWYFTHNRMAERAQRGNVEYVLKGSGDTGLDKVAADKLHKDLKQELTGEKFPELEDKNKNIMTESEINVSDVKGLPEAMVDMQRVHRLISLITPEFNANPPSRISPDRLVELHGQWKRMLGNAVTDNDMFDRMQYHLIGKGIKNIGISGLSGGYNMHAAIHELVISKPFNTDSGMRIPKVEQVNSMIDALDKKVLPETKKEMKEYYDRVVATLKNSTLGSIKVSEMTEQMPGEWYEAIRGSMVKGKGIASRFAHDRILEVIRHAEDVGDQLNFYALELQATATNEASLKTSELAELQFVTVDQTKMLVDQLKRGIESGDGLIIHHYADRMDRINELLDLAVQTPIAAKGRHAEYTQEILKQIAEARADAAKDGWTEATVKQQVTDLMDQMHVPEKDRLDIGLKISASQFSQRYDIGMDKMTDMFLSYRSMDRTVKKSAEGIMDLLNRIDLEARFDGKPIYSEPVRKRINDQKRLIAQVLSKGGSPDPNKFWDTIVKPLMSAVKWRTMQKVRHLPGLAPLEGWEKFNQQLISDISSITSSYFSSMPMKHYTYRNSHLFVEEKQVGYTEKYGAQGVKASLNNSAEISVLANSFYIGDKYVSQPSERQMNKIIQELEAGVPVSYENGFRQYLGESKKIVDQQIAQGKQTQTLNDQKFTVVSADESTLLLVRLSSENLIQKDLMAGFQKSNVDIAGNRVTGGHLFERMTASLNVNRNGDVQYPTEVRTIVDKINNNEKLTTHDIQDAINLTRVLNDRPDLIYRWAELSAEERKSAWKYLKLSELKGGFVGHDENLARVRSFLEGAAKEDKTGFYNTVLDNVRDFLPVDKNQPFPKLKLVSVADEMVHEGNKINIFSALDYKRAELEELNRTGLITDATLAENIESLKKVSKSIVDGATYLSSKAYVSSLAMMGGLSPDMIEFHPDGSIKEIKIGGIKPTISHADVKTNMSNSDYGRVMSFYAKTAFHYDPIFDGLLSNLKVDGVIFNSSNKVNEFRDSQKNSWYNTDLEKMESTLAGQGRNVHATFPGIDNPGLLPKDYNGVAMWLGQHILAPDHTIHHIPFDAINLRSLGQPHDPLVGSNLSVHMHDHVGIRQWIDLDNKVRSVYEVFDKSVDPIYATKLAKQLFAHSADTGDMAWVNTGIDHFLKHEGLLTSPWQRTMLEEKIIPYFMNNGMIAAGRVNEGSLDVMSPDLGGLKTSVVRTHRDKTKSIQFYGEFVQSKHAAEKPFKRGGGVNGEGKEDVRSVLVQRIEFRGINPDTNNRERRDADAFFIDRGSGKMKERILVVDGLYIDKEGNRRSLYNNETVPYHLLIDKSNAGEVKFVKASNRSAYQQALKREDVFFESIKDGKDMNYSQVMTKLYEYDKANPGFDMALGSLNNRQPRNQVGDVVLARLKVREDAGRIKTHNGELRGNSSRMNYADAINPQDADYDMDKSSSFLAAPNNLWGEAARLGGYRVVNDVNVLEMIYEKEFSSEYPKMFHSEERGDPKLYGMETNATVLNRGRFVKLHQTLTYLHNMFRDNPTLVSLRSPLTAHDIVDVRLKTSDLAYVDTIEHVTKTVKLFLDLYKQNPKHYTKNPEEMIRKILFGFKYGDVTHDGMFELWDPQQKQRIQDKKLAFNDYEGEVFSKIRDDIYWNLLSPLNKYLRFNRGTTVDETNRDVSATLDDYQRGHQQLLYAIKPHESNFNYENNYTKQGAVVYDNRPMFKKANDYIADSHSPFDVAMRGLHRYANNSHGFDEMRVGTREILDYISEGNTPSLWDLDIPKGLEYEFKLNKVSRIAMQQLAAKDGEIVRLEGLASQLRRIDAKIEYLDGISGPSRKDVRQSMEYTDLVNKKLRMTDFKTTIEENLSYNPKNKDNEKVNNPSLRRTKDFKGKRTKPGEWKNKEYKPVVVVTSEGKTKEVIMPGRKNFKEIHWSDTLVINGHRYEVMDGQTQLGLRSEYRAYGGTPHLVVNKKDGSTVSILPAERAVIDQAYYTMRDNINELYAKTDKTQASIAEYAARKTALIIDMLESPDFAFKPVRQLALVFRMLRPNWDSKVSPIIPVRYSNQSKTSVVGNVKFTENKLAKGTFNTLAQIANGTVEIMKGNSKGGIDKSMAAEMLKDIINLQRSYYMQEMYGKEVNMNKLEKIGYTEPTELPNGYMTDAKFLDKRIFDRMRDGNAMQQRAAGTLYKYLSGQAFVDPATLYKASKEMEASGIPITEQFMMKTYDPATDQYHNAELRNFSIIDAYRSQDRGQGGVLREKGSRSVKELWMCLNITGS